MRRKFARMVAAGFLAAAVLCPGAVRAHAQEPGEQAAPPGGVRGGQYAGMQRVAGTVSAVSGANVTLKSIENGQDVTVTTTTNTRMMRGAGESFELSSLKPGDGLVAMGQLDAPNHTLHAGMLFALSPDQVKQMNEAVAVMRANMGKTYIAGRVTAVDIDNGKMTVQRSDGQTQTIGFDEGTSFKKGGHVTGIGGGAGMFPGGGVGGGRRGGGAPGGGASTAATGGAPAITGGESITLADIKAGDSIVGLGSVKSGTFVPTVLNVNVRGEGGGRHRGDGQGGPAPGGPGL